MTIKQGEELSKYFYDLSKIAFALIVVGSLISKEPFILGIFIIGFLFTIISGILGFKISKFKED
ncbi:hypothetical protein KJ693_05795 [bacterium]|nr:hypothetical protein [bacterium]MBU1614811.1 hypothetical protein [bacterium]